MLLRAQIQSLSNFPQDFCADRDQAYPVVEEIVRKIEQAYPAPTLDLSGLDIVGPARLK